jgi:hypothetical protein
MPISYGVILSVLAAAPTSQTTPTLPGGIIAWVICNARKRSPIGGWLLFYYWQLYSGLLLSLVFFGMNLASYIPEYSGDQTKFLLFLASAAPGLILYPAQGAVATLLLSVRTWDMLKLVRWIILGQVVAAVVGVVIDATYFPDNQILSVIMLIQEALWLAYFYRSTRVRHIFNLQDWDTAVNLIYPPTPKPAT